MNISVSFGLHTPRRWEKVNECGNEQLQALNIYLPKRFAEREGLFPGRRQFISKSVAH